MKIKNNFNHHPKQQTTIGKTVIHVHIKKETSSNRNAVNQEGDLKKSNLIAVNKTRKNFLINSNGNPIHNVNAYGSNTKIAISSGGNPLVMSLDNKSKGRFPVKAFDSSTSPPKNCSPLKGNDAIQNSPTVTSKKKGGVQLPPLYSTNENSKQLVSTSVTGTNIKEHANHFEERKGKGLVNISQGINKFNVQSKSPVLLPEKNLNLMKSENFKQDCSENDTVKQDPISMLIQRKPSKKIQVKPVIVKESNPEEESSNPSPIRRLSTVSVIDKEIKQLENANSANIVQKNNEGSSVAISTDEINSDKKKPVHQATPVRSSKKDIQEDKNEKVSHQATPVRSSAKDIQEDKSEKVNHQATPVRSTTKDIPEDKSEKVNHQATPVISSTKDIPEDKVNLVEERVPSGLMKEKITPKEPIYQIISNTQPGKNEGGASKINQDSYLITENIFNLTAYNLFAVLDGHGSNGHLASSFCSGFLSDYYKNITGNQQSELSVYLKLKENDYEVIRKSFTQAEKELKHIKYDMNFSGTTCVLVIYIGHKIICANAGDSRAIMVSEIKNKKSVCDSVPTFEVLPLSNDHKPEVPIEKLRIINAGGRVEQYDEAGPYRVWLKSENYPGLAMSRSIGDFVASSVGVTSEPEIKEFELTENTRYIIIASDGVWEFLDNNKVMSMVNPYYIKNDPEGACNALIKKSTEWWEKEDVVVDDITVVVIFFKNPAKKSTR